MADNKITTGVTAIDVVFGSTAEGRHLTVPIVDRAEGFDSLTGIIAENEVAFEEDEGSPWHVSSEDSPEQKANKEAMREAYVDGRALTHLYAFADVIASAQMLRAMKMADAGWYNAHGEWTTLESVYADLVPDEAAQKRGGGARSLAQFVLKTVPILRAAGISDKEIAAAKRADTPTLVREIPRFVNRALQKFSGDELARELRIILRTAQTASTIGDFISAMKDRYRDPDEPPPPKALYNVERSPTDERVRFVAEMDSDLWDVFFRRLIDRLEQAPGSLFAAVSPSVVKAALEDPSGINGQRLMRAAITGDWARSICLDALEKRVGEWVEVTDITNVSDIPARAVRRAMAELCRYHFAVRHTSEEKWRLG